MTDVMLLAMVKVKRGDICLGNLQVLLSARYSWLWMKGYFFFFESPVSSWTLSVYKLGFSGSKWKLNCCNTNGDWLSGLKGFESISMKDTDLWLTIAIPLVSTSRRPPRAGWQLPHVPFGISHGFGFGKALQITAESDVSFLSPLINSGLDE